MALTFDRTVAGTGKARLSNKFETVTKVTFDSSYASGGEAYTANDLGLSTLTAITSIYCDGPYRIRNDVANAKLRVYGALMNLTTTVTFAGATDSGATGTWALGTLPAGSHVESWEIVTTTAWTGETSAVAAIGIAGATTAFSADSAQSVFTAGTVGSAPLAAAMADNVATAISPILTITVGADFTNVNTNASSAVSIFYSNPPGDVEATTSSDLSSVVCYVTAIGT